ARAGGPSPLLVHKKYARNLHREPGLLAPSLTGFFRPPQAFLSYHPPKPLVQKEQGNRVFLQRHDLPLCAAVRRDQRHRARAVARPPGRERWPSKMEPTAPPPRAEGILKPAIGREVFSGS